LFDYVRFLYLFIGGPGRGGRTGTYLLLLCLLLRLLLRLLLFCSNASRGLRFRFFLLFPASRGLLLFARSGDRFCSRHLRFLLSRSQWFIAICTSLVNLCHLCRG
jgi:hypothetical protein